MTLEDGQARRPRVVLGNWKMNLGPADALALVEQLTRFDMTSAVDVAVFPPFTSIPAVGERLRASRLRVGAQDLAANDEGAYTGEVSGSFLSELGVEWVLVGHSERRIAHLDDDQTVADKVAAAVRHGITPVICVGETSQERGAGDPARVPARQLSAALTAVSLGDRFAVAYEPIWAIGSGVAATVEDASQMCSELRSVVSRRFGSEDAARHPILYGGSVTADNAAAFFAQPDIDGVLVGGASLDATRFARIVHQAAL
jgi:triosephosphate isomerase (TIM)